MANDDLITEDRVLLMLGKAVKKAGTQDKFGLVNNVTGSLVSQTMCKHCPPSAAILHALGLEKVIMYRVKRE